MPNRVLRDWTDSEKVNSLSCQAERFFTRLIMRVDDFGCYSMNLKLIKSSLFPLLIDEVREADISRWMAECQKAGLILFYEVDNKKYLQIVDFKQRLRQKIQKYPLPPQIPSQTDDGQLSDNGRLETNRNEEETKGQKPPPFDPSNYYKSPSEAFEEIKANETLMEQLTRIVHQQGFRTAEKIHVMLAVKNFLTVEGAKDEFTLKPKKEVKSHLINWMNKNAARITETNGVSR